MKLDWSRITAENVIEAIRIFDTNIDEFPLAMNTFLEYKGIKYPAKHIRSLAYKVAFGIEAPKSEFSGGLETVRFFEKLGFSMRYFPKSISNAENKKPAVARREKYGKLVFNTNMQSIIITTNTKEEKEIKEESVKITSKYVIEQKNALQLVLNRYFNGDIVSEKTFGWLTTPTDSKEYPYLLNALHKYRGMRGFDKVNYKLRCDFVCESRKLIFEYDERQHFSLARKASLESYPENIPLYFDKKKWVAACESINAKDNYPANRDETRAYYDSMRDILCAQNGYRLVRIMHSAYDWENPDASKYIDELISFEPIASNKERAAVSNLKIGLYLQGKTDFDNLIFEKRLKDASKENLDIFVFPETCYTPYTADFYSLRLTNQDEISKPLVRAMQISRQIGCAVIIGAEDKDGLIYNIYANAFASGDETPHKLYIKHTMASNSPLSFTEYKNNVENIFNPIILKGLKIGMTICYDCNHAAFSRAWGKRGVDIIINSTGGNVIYQKWYRYNKVRSLENKCFSFCTMGYAAESKINSYTFAFTPNGALMSGKPIYPITSEKDRINNIFVYDTADFDGKSELEISLNQDMTPNTKSGQWKISPIYESFLLDNSKKIMDGLYYYGVKGNNVIICCVDGLEILRPEKILCLLYNSSLKSIPNKRYLIINRWPAHDTVLYDTVLSDILKVRTAENFCAVIYSSPEKTMCFQAGKNKNVQSVMLIDGKYSLDFGRMTGPEAIWKNKGGMRASWRKGYEALISTL